MDFTSPEFIFVGANDPSLGKNKKSDTSSIINLAVSLKSGYMYVVDASVEKRKPDVIIEDVFEMNRRLKRDCKKGFFKFGVETVQFQYYFKEVMAKKSAEEGEYLPIRGDTVQCQQGAPYRVLAATDQEQVHQIQPGTQSSPEAAPRVPDGEER